MFYLNKNFLKRVKIIYNDLKKKRNNPKIKYIKKYLFLILVD